MEEAMHEADLASAASRALRLFKAGNPADALMLLERTIGSFTPRLRGADPDEEAGHQ